MPLVLAGFLWTTAMPLVDTGHINQNNLIAHMDPTGATAEEENIQCMPDIEKDYRLRFSHPLKSMCIAGLDISPMLRQLFTDLRFLEIPNPPPEFSSIT